MSPHVSCCMDTLHLIGRSYTAAQRRGISISLPTSLYLRRPISNSKAATMALLLLHALLLAGAAATAALDNATSDGSNSGPSVVLCNGAGCEPLAQPLPIYGYPPPATPSLPSAPPAPPSAPGTQTPCPPVAVVCCGGGGAGGQYTPQQPNNNAPPSGGYVPYYNSASPPALLAPVTAGYYFITVLVAACLMLQWIVV